VGSAFSFGHQRGGNVALLKLLGRELGFTVRGLAAVSLDSKTISSSRVRKAIQTGDLDAASQMLGRPYTLQGAVMSGDGLGRALGFPTANLDASGLVLPPSGVYVVQAQFQGRTYPAVVNIGVRPTIQRPLLRLQVEAHLLDFQGDLRGTLLEIAFLAPLRAEQKFSSPEALRAQIQRDIATARNFLSARRSPSSRIPGQT
jgi:riboflavin kinase/FMN adenylyltransferase